MVATASSSAQEQVHSTEPEPRDHESHAAGGMDADEPSADWGWHGSFPVGSRIAGWVTAVGLFCMVFFSHGSFTELYWLLAAAVVLVVALIANEFKRRRGADPDRR